MSRRKKHGLTPEDLELWKIVTQSIAPLTPDRAKPAPDDPANPGAPAQKSPSPQFRAHQIMRPKPLRQDPKITVDVRPDPLDDLRRASANMDRKTYDRLRKGRLRPDRRIDLHGMTIAVAQTVLTNFVLSAHADGARVLLVITGKGRIGPTDAGVIPGRRGVIRQSVPHWLSIPPLQALVVQTLPAADRHGGSGAYYIYLKRQR